jgi:DNA-binding MarR family transcriptional regulator
VPEPYLSAWRALLNAHVTLVGEIERDLADANLPPLAWCDVLWALRRAPGGGIRMGRLAATLTLSRGGLTKLADRLEEAGLLRRELAGDDRRGFYAVLTEQGEQMLRRMWPVYSAALRRLLVGTITPEEATVVTEALTRATALGRRTPAE